MFWQKKKEETPKQKKPAGKKSETVSDPQKAFLNAFNKLTNRHRAWDAWRDIVTMFACALSNPVDKEHYDDREALYLRTIKKYNKQEQALFPELAAQTVLALEKNPEQDFLGSIFMSLNLGNESNGQFFTPYHVCELMDDTVQKVEQDCYISVNENYWFTPMYFSPVWTMRRLFGRC